MSSLPALSSDCLATTIQPAARAAILDLLNTRLHPALRAIVAAEVAAGKRVIDAGADWPDAGSVHVTLRDRFGEGHANAQAVFSRCGDPHYWHADYSTVSAPRHLLIC